MSDERLPDEPDDELAEDDDAPTPTDLKTVSAASVGTVRKAERRQKREAREAEEFWRAVFSTPVGRREIWRLLDEAGAFETRFACTPAGFPDPKATWFHYGQRELGQRLYQGWLFRLPDEIRLMHAENDRRFPKQPHRQDD